MCLEGLTPMCFSCLLEKRKVQRDFPKSKANFLLFKYLEMNFNLSAAAGELFKLFNIRNAAKQAKTCCD